jgi:hypothetical protein
VDGTSVMRAQPNRPINADEVRIIRAALDRCAEIPNASVLAGTLDSLRVVGGCECGCASADFAIAQPERKRPIADGLGILPNGEQVGLIVWGTSEAITGLEVYDLSATVTDLPLSEIQAVIPWEEGAT